MAELLAQLGDVDLDRARLAGGDEAPHRLEQLVARDHLAGAAHEIVEQIELALGEHDLAAVDVHLAGAARDRHRSDARPRRPAAGGAAARRSTALTRATSSRGENGLVT